MPDSSTKPRDRAASPRAEARAARESLYRDHILTAAEKVFADKPFEEAKVQDISTAAGLSMGSIYAIFAGKDEIYASIADRRSREILARVRDAVQPQASPLAALEALATTYVDYFCQNTDFLRMNLRGGTAWALRPQREHNVAKADLGARRDLPDGEVHGYEQTYPQAEHEGHDESDDIDDHRPTRQ